MSSYAYPVGKKPFNWHFLAEPIKKLMSLQPRTCCFIVYTNRNEQGKIIFFALKLLMKLSLFIKN